MTTSTPPPPNDGHDRRLLSRMMRQGWAGVVMRAFGMAAGFLAAWLSVRLLGDRDFGVYSTLLAVISVAAAVVGFGMRNTLIRMIAEARSGHGDVGSLMRGAVLLAIALFALVGVTLALAHEQLRALLDAPPIFTTALFAMLPTALLWGLRMIMEGFLAAEGRLTLTYYVEFVVRSVASVGVLVALLLTIGGADDAVAEPIVALSLALVAVDAALMAWMYLRHLPRATRSGDALSWALTIARTSAPVALRRVIDTLLGFIDRLMLAALTGEMVAVGVFSIARKLSELAMLPNMILGQSFESMAATLWIERRRAQLAQLYRQAAFLGFAAAAGLALGLALWTPFVLPLFGSSFADGYVPMMVLLFGPLISIAFGPSGAALIMSGHTRSLPWVAATSLALHVVGAFVLIPPLGMLGAAYTSLVASAAANALLAWVAHRRVGVAAMSPALAAFIGLLAIVGGAALALSLLWPGLGGSLAGSALAGTWLALHARWFARRHDVSLRGLVRLRGLVTVDRDD